MSFHASCPPAARFDADIRAGPPPLRWTLSGASRSSSRDQGPSAVAFPPSRPLLHPRFSRSLTRRLEFLKFTQETVSTGMHASLRVCMLWIQKNGNKRNGRQTSQGISERTARKVLPQCAPHTHRPRRTHTHRLGVPAHPPITHSPRPLIPSSIHPLYHSSTPSFFALPSSPHLSIASIPSWYQR